MKILIAQAIFFKYFTIPEKDYLASRDKLVLWKDWNFGKPYL